MMATQWMMKLLLILMYLCPSGRSFTRLGPRIVTFCIGVEGAFRFLPLNFDDNPRMYKNAFRRHNSHVLHSVPKEKLLVYKPGDGWEPLCEFLGKEVPDIPFPHKNKDSAHFKEDGGSQHPAYKRLIKEVLIVLAVLVGICSVAVYYLFSYLFS